MTKYPVLFIFNRVTGEPIYEIEERPVSAGNLPGEYYSPTQPFPVKPPPFGRIRFTMDDIATVTPEHTAACRERLMAYDGGRNRGPFTPPSLEGALVFSVLAPLTVGGWTVSTCKTGTYAIIGIWRRSQAATLGVTYCTVTS